MQQISHIWYLAQFSGWFQFLWFTCISAETVFSQVFNFNSIYHARKITKDFFYEGCSIFFIDLNSNMGLLTLYSKCVDALKMLPVSHLTMHNFQKYLLQFTRCNKIMKH